MLRTALAGLTCALLLSACRTMGEGVEVISNASCPVSGQPVSDAYYEYEGKQIFTCCKKCVAKVKADPEAALARAYPAK